MANHAALDGILCLTTITPLHPGAGSGMGLLDNPIMRERSTQYPFVQSSTLKGNLRAISRNYSISSSEVIKLFGPEREKGTEHQGALVLTDARLLAMPVRSFKGVFVWITSPVILNRFFRDFAFLGRTIKRNGKNWDWKSWLSGIEQHFSIAQVLIPDGSQNRLLLNGKLYLEEYELSTKPDNQLSTLSKCLSSSFFENDFLRTMFQNQLVVLHNDLFNYFIVHATQVEANIAINHAKGTTIDGSLRYTEYLPEETCLFAGYKMGPDRSQSGNTNLLSKFENNLIGSGLTLQMGGDETTGKGIVQIKRLQDQTTGVNQITKSNKNE